MLKWEVIKICGVSGIWPLVAKILAIKENFWIYYYFSIRLLNINENRFLFTKYKSSNLSERLVIHKNIEFFCFCDIRIQTNKQTNRIFSIFYTTLLIFYFKCLSFELLFNFFVQILCIFFILILFCIEFFCYFFIENLAEGLFKFSFMADKCHTLVVNGNL